MVRTLLYRRWKRQKSTERVCGNRKQVWNRSPAQKSNRWLWGKEIRCEVWKHHSWYAARSVGGGRTETRQSQQWNGNVLSGNGQPYQTAPDRKPKAENRNRRPFTGIYRLSQLWRYKSWRYNRKGTQQRVSPIVFGCFTRGVPFCSIPEKADNL